MVVYFSMMTFWGYLENNNLFFIFYKPLSLNENTKRNILFNDALNTFYLRLYGVRRDTTKDKNVTVYINTILYNVLIYSFKECKALLTYFFFFLEIYN